MAVHYTNTIFNININASILYNSLLYYMLLISNRIIDTLDRYIIVTTVPKGVSLSISCSRALEAHDMAEGDGLFHNMHHFGGNQALPYHAPQVIMLHDMEREGTVPLIVTAAGSYY